MQFHFHTLIVTFLFLNCVVGQQGPPPKAKRPSIVIQEHGLILVMNSANVTVRSLEKKEESVQATFTKATAEIQPSAQDNVVTLKYDAPSSTSPKELTITEFSLTLRFTNGGYWSLVNSTANLKGSESKKTIDYKNVPLISDIGLYAPDGWSFHCGRFGPLYPGEIQGNHTFQIDLNGFQVEPFKNDTKRFSQAYECVGFFSIGILSGVFVTLILLAVLTWGLIMILDVKTMDRFDDPKGKPISFGGPE